MYSDSQFLRLMLAVVSDEWTSVRCDVLPDTPEELLRAAATIILVAPTPIYIILIRVILGAIPEEDAINDEVSTLRLASRIVWIHFVVALTLFAPLQVSFRRLFRVKNGVDT